MQQRRHERRRRSRPWSKPATETPPRTVELRPRRGTRRRGSRIGRTGAVGLVVQVAEGPEGLLLVFGRDLHLRGRKAFVCTPSTTGGDEDGSRGSGYRSLRRPSVSGGRSLAMTRARDGSPSTREAHSGRCLTTRRVTRSRSRRRADSYPSSPWASTARAWQPPHPVPRRERKAESSTSG